MGRVQGKVCVITGAARGLGLAAAEALLAEGGTYTWLVSDGWVVSTDARGDASLTRKTQTRKQAQP